MTKKVKEALQCTEMERFLRCIAQGRVKVNSGGCYMKIIAEHTGCLLCCEFFTNTSFSVSVHCQHQWRKVALGRQKVPT